MLKILNKYLILCPERNSTAYGVEVPVYVTLIINIVCFFLVLSTPFTYGQTDQKERLNYIWFDSLAGQENSELYNGIGYVEKYRVINEYHKFFISADFLPGSINYRGQSYFGLKVKYDLDEDKLIVSLDSGSGIVFLQPIKSWINNFVVDGHQFLHVKDEQANAEIPPGFYEVLLKTPVMTLLKRNKKNRFKRTKKKVVYYEFKTSNETILFYNNTYHRVNSRSDFLKIFPQLKSEIKKYSNRTFQNPDRSEEMIGLINRISVIHQDDH